MELKKYFKFTESLLGLITVMLALASPAQGGEMTDLGIASVYKLPTNYQVLDQDKKIKADVAWSRGWTGLNTKILIIDSGINEKHLSFQNQVVAKINLMSTIKNDQNVNDISAVGHGTHVASIAAGNLLTKHNVGGVAFEADLLIAKASTTLGVTLGNAVKALQWARAYDPVVANLSSNVTYDQKYMSSMQKLADGTFYSLDSRYPKGSYFMKERPDALAAALGPNTVLVVSAGNQGLAYTQSPAAFAASTDSQGNLLFGGRMLVVGSWNTESQKIDSFSDRAGHICLNSANGACQDKFRTSDFYLLAPGANSMGANARTTDGVKAMSGTSMAAPAVTGAVAIISQMWPRMTGENIVKLLTTTADKNLPGYTKEVFGQGLLNLDKATQPVGAMAIPTQGRVSMKPITGSIAVAGLPSSVSSGLSSVVVLDSFSRDFRVNLAPAAFVADLQHVTQLTHRPGQSWSSKFTGQEYTVNGFSTAVASIPTGIDGQAPTQFMSFGIDSSIFNLGSIDKKQDTVYKFNYSQGIQNPWMYFDGMWGQLRSNATVELSATHFFGESGFWSQGGIMQSTTSFDKGLVTNVSPIISGYATMGWSNDIINIYAGVKPYMLSGSLNVSVPSSVDDMGNLMFTSSRINLRNDPMGYIGMSLTKKFIDTESNSHVFRLTAVATQNQTTSLGGQWRMTFN